MESGKSGRTEDDGLDAGAAAEEAAAEIVLTWDDDGDAYEISFGIHKSRRYHTKMAYFYGLWTDGVVIANALCGVGAFLALLGGNDTLLAKAFVGFVAIISATTAALSPAKKLKVHSDLTRRFTTLAAEIAERVPSPNNIRWAIAERLKIEADEPPERRLVDLQARNEECRARGHLETDLIPLSTMQRKLGYVATFGVERLEKWKADREVAAVSGA